MLNKSIFAAMVGAILCGQAALVRADSVGERITVTVQGAGPDVVLIPGLASSGAVWDATVARLKGHYRLHVVQVAGFAGAPAGANAQGLIIQPTVEALDAYIKTNRLAAPAVIGHSLGGLMGMMLAQEHPEDVGRLMIVDALPFFSALFGVADAEAAKPQAAGMRDKVLGETPEAYADSQRQFLPMLVKSPAGLKLVTRWALASDQAVVARATYEDMTTDWRGRLHEIKTPVTMLYPWDAASGFPQTAVDGIYQQNFAALPNKTLVRIDNSRHFIMLDQPAVFAERVDVFLRPAKTEP